MLSIQENTDNSVTIKNQSSNKLLNVCIYYKYFMEGEQLLVGGVTQKAVVGDLLSGQVVTVRPNGYLTGASAVVVITVNEAIL